MEPMIRTNFMRFVRGPIPPKINSIIPKVNFHRKIQHFLKIFDTHCRRWSWWYDTRVVHSQLLLVTLILLSRQEDEERKNGLKVFQAWNANCPSIARLETIWDSNEKSVYSQCFQIFPQNKSHKSQGLFLKTSTFFFGIIFSNDLMES